MDDVTKAELGQIRGLLEQTQRDLERLEGIAEGIFHVLIRKEKRDEWMEWWGSEDAAWMRRWRRGTPVTELRLSGATSHLINDADLITLEEVAKRPRREVAAIDGVGRVSLRKLDAALAEHGLSWAAAD